MAEWLVLDFIHRICIYHWTFIWKLSCVLSLIVQASECIEGNIPRWQAGIVTKKNISGCSIHSVCRVDHLHGCDLPSTCFYEEPTGRIQPRWIIDDQEKIGCSFRKGTDNRK